MTALATIEDIPIDQGADEIHEKLVGGEQAPEPHAIGTPTPIRTPRVIPDQRPAVEATDSAASRLDSPRLLDPTLSLAADILDDLERVRIANENRLRTMTRNVEDVDGEIRGWGLDERHPDVARLAAMVDQLKAVEHAAELNLGRAMRAHLLGPWVQATVGIGLKQGARLLAAIGDPYWNTLHDRPRTVSELWAYCGLHTLPADHAAIDTHPVHIGGGRTGSGNPDQTRRDSQASIVWVAVRRQRGQKSNWSTTAKMRAWNCATSCIKQAESPYRATYEARRAETADRLHAASCVRCGPAGKPALVGTPWSAGHQHADGLRIVSKRILADLWQASRDIYGGAS